VHAEFADAYDNREVTRSELGLADRLHGFANAVDLGDFTIPDDFDVRSEAFGCAASLQDLQCRRRSPSEKIRGMRVRAEVTAV
jgi:hypothetical protein